MVRMRNLLLLGLLFTVACASAPPPRSLPPAAPLAPASADFDEFKKALEEARALIATRDASPLAAPRADVQAAASMPIPDHRSVHSALALFTNRMRDDIQTYLTRSARYKTLIDQALADYNLPRALAYLPVIESGYSTPLTSRAGARGVWQFMPDTAREYGMRVDWWVDERCDPERSTRAAAKFLRDLYREFGDWPLALAAYNAGPGRIRRAMRESGASTYWELLEMAAIPKETRGYVPTFYATIMIASDPATYGFRLTEPHELDVKRIEIEGPVSLNYLAEIAGIDRDVVREMNPAFRRGILPPGRSAVRLPGRAAEEIAARGTNVRDGDASIAICSFTLRRGDTLKRLARTAGVTVETLLAMNGRRPTEHVGEGDSIYLPVRARDLGALLAQSETYYAVEKGDTLYSIARRHNLTVAELRDLNDLTPNAKVKKGQRLLVTQPRTVTAGGM